MQIQRNYRNANINRNDKNNQKLQYDTKYDDILFDMGEYLNMIKINAQVHIFVSRKETKQN